MVVFKDFQVVTHNAIQVLCTSGPSAGHKRFVLTALSKGVCKVYIFLNVHGRNSKPDCSVRSPWLIAVIKVNLLKNPRGSDQMVNRGDPEILNYKPTKLRIGDI